MHMLRLLRCYLHHESYFLFCCKLIGIFYFLGIYGGLLYAQTPVLIKDINTQPDPSSPSNTLSSDPRFLVSHKGAVYFLAKQNDNTLGLWKSNGKATGTLKIKDLPGTAHGLTSVGNFLYFTADDLNTGHEIWVSDGTSNGTFLLKDIASGFVGSMPESYTDVNGTLYFVATDDTHGSELWKSNGTAAGTVMVKDILSGSTGSNPQSLFNFNGTLYFVANDGTNGYELWKSDGTAGGTVMVKDIQTGSESSLPQYFININGTLYFKANNGTNGYELWKSDGTAGGTVMVKDIASGAAHSMPQFLTNVNGTLYFAANDGQTGLELWKSNGTANGTVLVADIQSGAKGSEPRYLKAIGSTVYFSATNGITGQELWKSDGTSSGTIMVKNIRPGDESSSSLPLLLSEIKGALYFTATDGTTNHEWWRSGGTENLTTPLPEIRMGNASSAIGNVVSIADTLYFTADNGIQGTELWKLAACLPLNMIASDTTLCSPGAISLPGFVSNYNSFNNHVWRQGSWDGPIISNPSSVTLTSSKTDFFLVAQLGSTCASSARITIRTIAYPDYVGSVVVMLEGAYRRGFGVMSNQLNQQGLLPGQTPISPFGQPTPAKQPYSGSPWFYNGNESIGSYGTNVTDWVLVSLRTNRDDPKTTVFRAAATIETNGSVSNIKGCPSKLENFTNYYVAVEHRNHVGIVSATPTLFINNHFFYDFTITQSYIPAGIPGIGQKYLDNRYMMYVGDIQKNQVGDVNAGDIVLWQQQNGQFSRYSTADMNLDGAVNALDNIMWLTNNGLFTGAKF